jgi:hypothetical protein
MDSKLNFVADNARDLATLKNHLIVARRLLAFLVLLVVLNGVLFCRAVTTYHKCSTQATTAIGTRWAADQPHVDESTISKLSTIVDNEISLGKDVELSSRTDLSKIPAYICV